MHSSQLIRYSIHRQQLLWLEVMLMYLQRCRPCWVLTFNQNTVLSLLVHCHQQCLMSLIRMWRMSTQWIVLSPSSSLPYSLMVCSLMTIFFKLLSFHVYFIYVVCNLFICCFICAFILDSDHVLRGSDSTVLTATGQVDGKWRTLAYVTWPIFIILGPLYISGMGTAEDFKFGVLIDCQAYRPTNAKVGQKGVM